MAGSKHTPNSKWNEDRPQQAYELALLGYTDEQIAQEMGVHTQLIDYWKKNKPEFCERLKAGKAEADQKVVNAFYLNCLDRWVEEEEVHVYKGQITKVTVRRFIQGDKWAQARWLSLRQRSTWSEVQRIENIQTNVNILKLDFSGLSTEELMLVKKIGLKQLTEHVSES